MHAELSRVWSSDVAAESRHARIVVLRTMRAGAELVGAKSALRLDADAYLVAGGGLPYISTPEPGAEPLAIELILPDDAATAEFLPALRSTLDPVGQRIAEIAAHRPRDAWIALRGNDAAALWASVEREERTLRARAFLIRCAKPATRDTLFRRLLLCADFIQSHYDQPLNVGVLAAVSNLSPFHFARLFALVMDETPHAFLVRKRLTVARRLLATGMGRADVAERTGFGCRSTLFRQLRGAAPVPS